VTDAILQTIVSEYTREAGVRQLERELGSCCARRRQHRFRQAPGSVTVDVEVVRDALGRQAFYRSRRSAPQSRALQPASRSPERRDVPVRRATSMKGKQDSCSPASWATVMKESARIALPTSAHTPTSSGSRRLVRTIARSTSRAGGAIQRTARARDHECHRDRVACSPAAP